MQQKHREPFLQCAAISKSALEDGFEVAHIEQSLVYVEDDHSFSHGSVCSKISESVQQLLFEEHAKVLRNFSRPFSEYFDVQRICAITARIGAKLNMKTVFKTFGVIGLL